MSRVLRRRQVLTLAAAGGLAMPWVARAAAATPGVTKTSIKIGQTMPYSGPASAWGIIGRTEMAFFRMLNAGGGIHGRTLYQVPHPVTVLAQARWVMEVRRSGVFISLFQASQQASTMAS